MTKWLTVWSGGEVRAGAGERPMIGAHVRLEPFACRGTVVVEEDGGLEEMCKAWWRRVC